MPREVTITISDEAIQRAQEIASQAHRPYEDILSEWIDRFTTDPPVDLLPDQQVLALCDQQLDRNNQEALNTLLDKQREGTLADGEPQQLEALMALYRHSLVRKAQAVQVAVARKLIPSLS